MTIRVLGIGNVLWADEGFGVRCLEALLANYQFSPSIELIDGGTQGLYLLEYVQESTHLIILDAIDYGLPAGSLKVVEDADVPKFLGAKKMSLHQTGFQEVLQLSLLTGHYPESLVLIGCQPAQIEDYGGSLTDTVKQAIAPALQLAVERLQSWGVSVTPRACTNPMPLDPRVTNISETGIGAELAIELYEQGRPNADIAWRHGDERFRP